MTVGTRQWGQGLGILGQHFLSQRQQWGYRTSKGDVFSGGGSQWSNYGGLSGCDMEAMRRALRVIAESHMVS